MRKLTVKPFFSVADATVEDSNIKNKNCLECGLFRTAKSPKMPPTGEGRLNTLILLEAPGKTEDEMNMQLVGEAGRFFRSKLKERGLDLDRDFWKTNSIICRPYTKKEHSEANRPPKRKELKLCKQNYMEFINKVKPRFIWLMGKCAIESFYMDRYSDDNGTDLSPSRWRALCIPDPDVNAWVIPLFHPSYAIRNEHDELIVSQFERDLDFAISCLRKEEPKFFDPFSRVKILKNFDDVKSFLEGIILNPPKEFAFDYETTGIKPFNTGHKIASVSFCSSEEEAYAFPLQHPVFSKDQQNILCKLWKRILNNDSDKYAHNLKYEDIWSQQILKIAVNNWKSCTMTTAHIIDNREGFTGLKFQAYIRWGVPDYDKATRIYLKTSKDSEFNKVFEAPLEELLVYNAVDALLCLKLAHEQEKELSIKQKKARDFFCDGLIALADIQVNGIPADRKMYEMMDKNLEEEMLKLTKDLLSSKEAKEFKQKMGRELSLTSDYDLRDLFFKVLGFRSLKSTQGGLPSVDSEVLNSLDSDFARGLVYFNKISKIRGTYIAQYLREIDEEGKIRPFFDLNKADTYRSSSQRPNTQNIPVRDEEAKKYTRSGIFPSPGNILLAFDYKALEVSIAACISQDPVLIEYCSDFSKDMHRDQAMKLNVLSKEEVSDELRFHAKNSFVFPEIYGSYYRSCAMNLWDIYKKDNLKTKSGVPIIEHLQKVGVINSDFDYDGFEEHVREVENEFWDRFKLLRKWQKRLWTFYKENGYIELATGFRCKGYMSRNKIVNSPIQGPAFHCLLYSLINIHNELIRREMKTKIINQIHDSLIADCFPDEKEEFMLLSEQIATKKIREEWKWIIVPLVISWEETEVNGSWFTIRKVKR